MVIGEGLYYEFECTGCGADLEGERWWCTECANDGTQDDLCLACKAPLRALKLSGNDAGFTYPDWNRDAREAESIREKYPILLDSFVAKMQRKQALHVGDRSSEQLRGLDGMQDLSYRGWQDDMRQAELNYVEYPNLFDAFLGQMRQKHRMHGGILGAMQTLLDEVRLSFLGIDAEAFQKLPVNAIDDAHGETGQWQTMTGFMTALSKRFDTFLEHFEDVNWQANAAAAALCLECLKQLLNAQIFGIRSIQQKLQSSEVILMNDCLCTRVQSGLLLAMPRLCELWNSEDVEIDAQELQQARDTRKAVSASFAQAWALARDLGYELLQNWAGVSSGHIVLAAEGQGKSFVGENVQLLQQSGAQIFKTAILLLRMVRRAPAFRVPCFPFLDTEAANVDMDARVCPVLQERLQSFADLEHEFAGLQCGDIAIEEHGEYFTDLLLQLHEHRESMKAGGLTPQLRIALAKKATLVLEEVLHFDLDEEQVAETQTELVLAMRALVTLKALVFLDTLSDTPSPPLSDLKRNAELAKRDMEAKIQISQSVVDVLRESQYAAPPRTCPQVWRKTFRDKCYDVFYRLASLHDSSAVTAINSEDCAEAQTQNAAAKASIVMAWDFQSRTQEESTCSVCSNVVCGEAKEQGDDVLQLAGLLAPVRVGIEQTEELIRELEQKDPACKLRKRLQEKQSKSELRKAIMPPEPRSNVVQQQAQADKAFVELLAEESAAAAAAKKKEVKADRKRERKAAQAEERKRMEQAAQEQERRRNQREQLKKTCEKRARENEARETNGRAVSATFLQHQSLRQEAAEEEAEEVALRQALKLSLELYEQGQALELDRGLHKMDNRKESAEEQQREDMDEKEAAGVIDEAELTFLSKFNLAPSVCSSSNATATIPKATATIPGAASTISSTSIHPSTAPLPSDVHAEFEALEMQLHFDTLELEKLEKEVGFRKQQIELKTQKLTLKKLQRPLLGFAASASACGQAGNLALPAPSAHNEPAGSEKECVICLQGHSSVKGWVMLRPCGCVHMCITCCDRLRLRPAFECPSCCQSVSSWLTAFL